MTRHHMDAEMILQIAKTVKDQLHLVVERLNGKRHTKLRVDHASALDLRYSDTIIYVYHMLALHIASRWS